MHQHNVRLQTYNDEKDEVTTNLKRQLTATMRANACHGNNNNDFICEEE